jgi:hypothetical protein
MGLMELRPVARVGKHQRMIRAMVNEAITDVLGFD